MIEERECYCGECDECREAYEVEMDVVGTLLWHPGNGEGDVDLTAIERYDWLSQADMLKDMIGILTEQYNKVISEDYIKTDMKKWKPVVLQGETE